ncbi:exosortase A [Telmatospirillum sp.]|uniref:exosortase A n=1 Tax=Telmatospirillum sp. TaxID=2079197 RepID=UPI002849B701|nr:exosortase A [Telmatospirillum sp.]MDR3439927.1 exosortase [Telmatospirillum sp.]
MVQRINIDHEKWKLAIFSATFLFFLSVFVFWNSASSAVSLWINSGAYNHCFLILPIFFYMVRSNRTELRGLAPNPSPYGCGVVLAFSIFWFFSFLSGIAEGAHFAIVGMLQGIFLALFGWRIYLRFLLPFSYLWLLVPSGEFLIPPLQMITAKAAAGLLDTIGIPTFRDGLVIEVPSGSYLVAPGCAGLNFVLASLATSMAYAELIYRSWRRRLTFVIVLLILAVVGNALRVFLIIAIAHATNNIGNIVDDHLLYGWGFFSLILLAVMMVGQRFRQDDSPSLARVRPPSPIASSNESSAPILGAALLSAVLMTIAPAVVWLGWPDTPRPAPANPTLSCGPLRTLAAQMELPPSNVRQVDALSSIDCGNGNQRLHFTVAVLDRPIRQGKLLGLDHRIDVDEAWSRVARRSPTLSIAGRPIAVQSDVEATGGRQKLVWSLFWADGMWRTPGLDTALADLTAELSRRRRAVLVQVEMEIDGKELTAEQFLRDFLSNQPLDRLAAGGED